MQLEQLLTAKNAKEYSLTMDKLIYCQDLTDLPLESKKLSYFEYQMWQYACQLGYCNEDD